MRRRSPGFTLTELLIVIAVAAILLTIGVPGFRDFILMQRLRSVNAQLVTDLNFARSEAVSRSQWGRVAFFSNDAVTCYTIYTAPSDAVVQPQCDCRNGAGAACQAPLVEVRTVSVPISDGVSVRYVPPNAANNVPAFAYSHINGRIASIPTDLAPRSLQAFRVHVAIDSARVLRTEVGTSGRVSVCAPASESVGAPPCP